MDCFYAAVERLDNPSLTGKPLAVAHDTLRGVVATASYEARAFGVHSAQSVVIAKRLCPTLVIVPPRMERYKEISRLIHNIFHRYTDDVEPISLDEAYLDVTSNFLNIPLATDIAKQIKRAIFQELHLTASAGVSYCKLLAKMASDFNKPNGICVVHPDKALSFLDDQPVEKLWLVGPKAAQEMHHMGICTVKQLRNISLDTLTAKFGKRGHLFFNYSRGIDDSAVISSRERKSISCEHTFEQDIWKKSAVIIELYHIVNELVGKICQKKFEGRTLTLKLKYANFSQVTRSITFSRPLNRKEDILPLAKQLLGKIEYSEDMMIRLLGLGVAHSSDTSNPHREELQLELTFDDF